MKTHWTEKRLRVLFERYNRVYWRGTISTYRVLDRCLERGVVGSCGLGNHVITVDCKKHTSDREIRGTLLHEMAHAAVGTGGHGAAFQAQLEKLLRARAPISIGTGEAGRGVQILANLVPPRFPLLKRQMDRQEARRANALNRYVAKKKLHTQVITDADIVKEFSEAEIGARRWKDAVVAIGLQYGLADDTGRPTTAHARQLFAKARKVHRRARRDHLEYEKLSKHFGRSQ